MDEAEGEGEGIEAEGGAIEEIGAGGEGAEVEREERGVM